METMQCVYSLHGVCSAGQRMFSQLESSKLVSLKHYLGSSTLDAWSEKRKEKKAMQRAYNPLDPMQWFNAGQRMRLPLNNICRGADFASVTSTKLV